MIIYNVTIQVETDIATDWLTWLKEEHIPEILATGCFHDATLLQLLEPQDEEGVTFAVQYKANTESDYQRYIEIHADTMRQKGLDTWGGRFIAFRSLMKVIH